MTDCLVVGAGIIGIACGLELLQRGKSVLILDENPPGSMTSAGNAGGLGITEVMPIASPGVSRRVPGWLFDPYGPLAIKWSHLPGMMPWLWRFHRQSSFANMTTNAKALRELLSICMGDTRELLTQTRLSDVLTENGALTVFPSAASFDNNQLEWRIKQEYGVEATRVDKFEVHDLEPNLRNVHSGWFTPAWCNVRDPLALTTALADIFLSSGGSIRREKVVKFECDENQVRSLLTGNGTEYQARQYIIAAGIWSKSLCRQLGEQVIIESERGYNTTLPDPGVEIGREIIFGEEKFVASTIGSKLRIGGAAEFAGIDAPPNYKRSDRLLSIAHRYLPELNSEGRENWMGQRPSTPDSLPVICASSKVNNVLYAFGHGHLGLTMAATTARLIGNLSDAETPSIDLRPCHIDRFN
ncbi:MAG: FAD-binding oxidoreductase [Gammaproteobacteria bacterium]|nr:FAD-binding oxidoreductase [Gammaproteobacteria bacterium]